ncbi:hypothetical protein BH09BAC1_BH09BAC1_03720 [soil metagenome]
MHQSHHTDSEGVASSFHFAKKLRFIPTYDINLKMSRSNSSSSQRIIGKLQEYHPYMARLREKLRLSRQSLAPFDRLRVTAGFHKKCHFRFRTCHTTVVTRNDARFMTSTVRKTFFHQPCINNRKKHTFALGQGLYDQLLSNPPGLDRSKGRWLSGAMWVLAYFYFPYFPRTVFCFYLQYVFKH